MKGITLVIIITFIPYCANSQITKSAENNFTEKKINATETQQMHIVTPVLLREYSQMNFQDEYAIRNGNKFHSLFSSLILPGSGQYRNRTWWKAGLFLAVEVTSIYLFVDFRNEARIGERDFEKFANKNWSVVEYSNWLVRYHEVNNLENPYIDELREMLNGEEATFNIQQDWETVDLSLLRNVERNTPYITSDSQEANNFSHTLPEYGSQQYYELISKYFQYQSGWRDYNDFHDSIGHTGAFFNDRYQIDRGGAYASTFFYQAAQLGDEFNTDYRRSGYFLSLLIANHIISAFDAYFTFQLKQNQLQASSSILPGKQLTLTYRF